MSTSPIAKSVAHRSSWTLVTLLWLLICLCSDLGCSAQTSMTVSVAQLVSSAQCSAANGVHYESATASTYVACGTRVLSIVGGVINTIANSTSCPDALSVHSDTGIVAVSCADRVISIRGRSVTILANSTQCAIPSSVFVDSSGTVYAACSDSIRGGVISIKGGVVTTIANAAQCRNPRNVHGNRATGVVYAGCSDRGVIAIKGRTITTIANATQCPSAGIVHVSSGGVIYASCSGAKVGAISIRNGTVTTIADEYQVAGARAFFAGASALFVACFSGLVVLGDKTVTTLVSPAQCSQPGAVSADVASGVVFVACSAGGVLSVRVNIVTQIVSPGQCELADSVGFNSLTGTVYATCLDPTKVLAMSGGAISTLVDYGACPAPHHVFSDDASGFVYVICVSRILAIRDRTTTTVVQCASSFRFNSASGVLYVACYQGVGAIRSGNVTTLADRTQCAQPTSVDVDPSTGIVFVACYNGIIAIDGSTVTTIATQAQCYLGVGVHYSAATGLIYAACPGGMMEQRKVIAINRVTRTVRTIANVSQCMEPTAIDTDSTGVVFAACYTGGVIAIRGNATTVMATPDQCRLASDVFVDRATQIVYAACSMPAVVSLSYNLACGPGLELTASGCTPCPIATFRSYVMTRSAQPSCVPCPAGQVAPVTGSVQCVVCAPSTYAVSAMLPCEPCRSGTYTSAFGSADVSLCPAGRYGSGPSNSSACSGPCAAGFWCPQGSTSPDQLPCGARSVYCPTNSSRPLAVSVGFYSASSADGTDATMTAQMPCARGSLCDGSGLARNCSAGTWQNQTGQESCVACAAGRFSSRSGAVECTPCGPGQSSSAGASLCTDCSPGRFIDGAQSSCVECAIGRFAANGASLGCEPCAIGHIAPLRGAAFCASCEPGQTNGTDAAGLPICVDCPVGRASSGGEPCVPCATGFSAAANKSITCLACTPGSALRPDLSVCVPCVAGRYAPESAATSCDPCPDGQVARHNGAAFCVRCEPGQSNGTDDSGQPSCVDCPVGRASSGGEPCTLCATGFSAPTNKSLLCQACSPGRYLRTDTSECIACAIGRFAPDAAATSCGLCPAGQIASNPGSAFCTSCAPGQTNGTDDAGFPVCVNCPAGRASAGGASCAVCTPGSFSLEASVFCSTCPTGTSQPLAGQSGCVECAPGRFAGTFNSSTCELCARGSFASGNGSAACTLCPQGTASAEIGSSRPCAGCLAGEYQSAVGSSSCFACDSRLTSNASAAACSTPSCDPGKQFNSHAASCVACPLGQSSSGGAGAECATCSVNTYTPVAGSACISCALPGMEGLTCTNGLASVKSGWWAIREQDAASGMMLYQTFPCAVGYCPGSPLQLADSNSSAAAIAYCDYPRLNSDTNLMCGACEDGYIPWGDACLPCRGVNGGLVFGALVLSFVLVLFLLRSGGSAAGPVVVLLFFLQTAALEVGSVSRWIVWLRVFNLGTESTSACIADWSPEQQTLFSILVPVFLLVELAAIALIHFGLSRWIQAQPRVEDADQRSRGASRSRLYLLVTSRTAEFAWSSYVGGAVSILLFCYTQVCNACLQFLYCVHVGPSLVVFSAPTVDCRSSSYRAYLVFVILAVVVFVVGLPLGALMLLMRNRAWLAPAARSSAADGSEPASALHQWRRCWGPLYLMYESRAWFWQPLVLVRRAAFVLTAVLLAQSPGVRFMLFLLLNFGSLQLHALVRPFSDPLINTAETTSYVLLVCVSALLTGLLPPYSTAVQILVFLLIVPPAVGWTAFTLRREWTEITAARKIKKQRAHSQAAVELAQTGGKPTRPHKKHDAASAADLESVAEFGASVHGPSDAPSDLELNPLHREASFTLAMSAGDGIAAAGPLDSESASPDDVASVQPVEPVAL